MRFQIQIHESADVVAATAFWASVVGVTPEAFLNPFLKRHIPMTNRKNIGAGYHGCLSVRVLRGASVPRQIEGIWWAVGRCGPLSVGDPSRVV